jgi:hypothetical protein
MKKKQSHRDDEEPESENWISPTIYQRLLNTRIIPGTTLSNGERVGEWDPENY